MRRYTSPITLIFLVAALVVQPGAEGATAHEDPMAVESNRVRSASDIYDNHLYAEDFEDGWADNWGWGPGSNVRVKKGSNTVLQVGPLANASYLFGQAWSDYVFHSRVKLLEGDLQLGFRQRVGDPNGEGGYFLAFFENGLILSRSRSGSFSPLIQKPTQHRLGRWYTVKIALHNARIAVFVDGVRRMRFVDPNPIPFGGISLSAPGPSSKAKFDDVRVKANLRFAHTWSLTKGPRGLGFVTTIATDPSGRKVYTGTFHSGIQRSNDRGETWTAVLDDDGLTQTKVRDIGIAPSDPLTIYATHQDRRAGSVTTDGGYHWKPFNLVGDWFEVSAVAVHPHDARHVYIGARTFPDTSSAQSDGIYETTDGGKSWDKLSAGSIGIHDLVIAPSNPDVIYAGTVSGLLKSTDGGQSWSAANGNPGPPGPSGLPMNQVIVDPRTQDTVYVRAFDQGPLLKTTDGGASWEQIRDGVTAIGLSPSQPDVLYSATRTTLWKSIDAGDSWSPEASSVDVGRWITAIAVDPSDPQRLHIGGPERIVISEDGGETVRAPSGNFRGAWSTAIATSQHDPDVVYVGHGGGNISKTTDGGATWQRVATLDSASNGSQNEFIGADDDAHVVTSIVTSALDPDFVLASNLKGIFRSDDGGNTFTEIVQGLQDPRIISLAIDPSNDARMFAGTGSHRPYLVYSGTGMYRSENGGASWQKILGLPEAPVPAIVVHPQNPDVVWASFMGFGVYRSADGGATWALANEGIAVPYVYSMAIDPTDPQVAYVTTIAYYGDPNYLQYQGQNVGGVYKTENGGETWELILLHDMMENVVVDPTDPSSVFATSHSEQVWHSADGGETWSFANDGLARYGAHLYFFGMAITADGSSIYLANCGRGVYRNRLDNPERP